VIDKLIAALEAEKWKEATWHAQAILRLRGVCKAQSSKSSTNILVPLSAVDLRTLLDTLLATPTSQDQSTGGTWRSRLKSLVKNLPDFKPDDSTSGTSPKPQSLGSIRSKRQLPSNRKYWPKEAKGVFWDLVRSLNKYDKEFAPGGTKSPIQLDVAEECTRRWWEMEYGYGAV